MENITNDCKTITVLIVANETFRIRLVESLKLHFNNDDKGYKVSLLFCEHVMEIITMCHDIVADFVVFVMDTESRICVKNVEYNLQLMNKDFIIGRMCIVDGNAHIPYMKLGVSLNDINALAYKYSCTLLNADIMDENSCLHLASRLFILITTSLGLNNSIPLFPWLS